MRAHGAEGEDEMAAFARRRDPGRPWIPNAIAPSSVVPPWVEERLRDEQHRRLSMAFGKEELRKRPTAISSNSFQLSVYDRYPEGVRRPSLEDRFVPRKLAWS